MLTADLRKARKSLGLTVKEFAMLMGVRENTISNLEVNGNSHRMFNIFLWGFSNHPKEGVLNVLNYWAHQGALDHVQLGYLEKFADRFILNLDERSTWKMKITTVRDLPPRPLVRECLAKSPAPIQESVRVANGVLVHRCS